ILRVRATPLCWVYAQPLLAALPILLDAQQALEALGVLEEQVGALVRREAAGEAECQRGRVQQALDALQLAGRAAVAGGLAQRAQDRMSTRLNSCHVKISYVVL